MLRLLILLYLQIQEQEKLLLSFFQRCLTEFLHCLFDSKRCFASTCAGCLVAIFNLSSCIFQKICVSSSDLFN